MPIGDVATGLDPDRVRVLQEGFNLAFAARCRECWALRLCRACFATQAASGDVGAREADCARFRRAEERNLALVVRALQAPATARVWLERSTVQ
jgi:hypothetical protein